MCVFKRERQTERENLCVSVIQTEKERDRICVWLNGISESLPPSLSSPSQVSLSIDHPQKVMLLGEAQDYGTCQAMKKNGDPCSQIVNMVGLSCPLPLPYISCLPRTLWAFLFLFFEYSLILSKLIFTHNTIQNVSETFFPILLDFFQPCKTFFQNFFTHDTTQKCF